jgi:hypothetical protein
VTRDYERDIADVDAHLAEPLAEVQTFVPIRFALGLLQPRLLHDGHDACILVGHLLDVVVLAVALYVGVTPSLDLP